MIEKLYMYGITVNNPDNCPQGSSDCYAGIESIIRQDGAKVMPMGGGRSSEGCSFVFLSDVELVLPDPLPAFVVDAQLVKIIEKGDGETPDMVFEMFNAKTSKAQGRPSRPVYR